MTLRVLISTGEASGDSVGAELLKEMRRQGFNGEFFAVGGRKLEAAGAHLIGDSSTWGALGVYQALKMAPKLLIGAWEVSKWLESNTPDLVIAIDFGYMNVRLCRKAKKLGCRVLYFMPPGSWRRDRQGTDLARVADSIATPFSWSADMLRKAGANVEWVGHQVLQMAGEAPEGERDVLAILPGSRKHEIELNLPVFARAVALLGEMAAKPVIVAAPNADSDMLGRLWNRHCPMKAEVSRAGPYGTLKRSRAAIICSGTATLEAAVCRTPMVAAYVLDPLMILEAKLIRLKVDFIALPNILLERRAVPELYHPNASSETIATETSKLLRDSTERQAQLDDFEEIVRMLGPNDAITRTAKMALELIQPHRREFRPHI
ncbi:MAG: lipid-A-disaccharide synthase [Fimbriimonadales bacterium]